MPTKEPDPPLTTSSAPVFVQNAEELMARLSQATSPAAKSLLDEARALSAAFRRWETEKPPNEVRVAAIQELLELNRRARELLAHGTHPPPVAESEEKSVSGFVRTLLRR